MTNKSLLKKQYVIFYKILNYTTSDKKKSVLLSSIVFVSLLILLFLIRFWPPSNITEIVAAGGGEGVTVNFGASILGNEVHFTNKDLELKVIEKPTKAKTQGFNEILTSENSDVAAVVLAKKKKSKHIEEIPLKDENKPIKIKKAILKKTDDAVGNILKGNSKGVDGNSAKLANQGRSNGDINSNGYLGGGENGGGDGKGSGNGLGIGNGPGYSLGNRKVLSKPAPNYNCKDEGKVVVEISVDRNGSVIVAKAGVKGTTNTSNCLLSQAKIAALNTKWEASADAPDIQIGKIIYNFSLN